MSEWIWLVIGVAWGLWVNLSDAQYYKRKEIGWRRMMTEWKEYTGSDEQIAEMLTTKTGFIVDSQQSIFKDRMILNMPITETPVTWLKELLAYDDVKKYLICNPHPHADMTCQQARTGQPVWVRYEWIDNTGTNVEIYVTDTPDWNIPNAEYSFTEFKGEV